MYHLYTLKNNNDNTKLLESIRPADTNLSFIAFSHKLKNMQRRVMHIHRIIWPIAAEQGPTRNTL